MLLNSLLFRCYTIRDFYFIAFAVVKNEDVVDGNLNDLIKLSTFLENPRIIAHVNCQEITFANYKHEW